jgi:hypothetical protein
MRFFTENETFTTEANRVACDVRHALLPIFEEYRALGFSVRDINSIVMSEAGLLCSQLIIEKTLRNTRHKKVDQKP